MVNKTEGLLQQSVAVKQVLVGEVVSDRMDKTVVVKVMRTFKHPLYGKTVRMFKKYKAHDEKNACKIGDEVEIAECRPLSKTKHMILNRILTKRS
ncbi:MAG: 30S ribosomal protein S17 [bacterium]